MITIEKAEVIGWEHAIRGLRNPMNSWDKSTSGWNVCDTDCTHWDECGPGYTCPIVDAYDNQFMLCKADLDLMTRLRNAGTDHRKFMRMLTVYVDLTAPLYWWKEFDTYKVGTVANSCSTMHTIHTKEFTLDDFSHEHLIDFIDTDGVNYCWYSQLDYLICHLNAARDKYLETNDKHYWWQMIQLLPSSYNQKRTVMLNYEVLANIYKSRKDHRLDEWHDLCHWIETLPYSQLITGN